MCLPIKLRRSIGAAILIRCLVLLGCCSSLHAQTAGTVDPVFGGSSIGLLGQVLVMTLQTDGKVLVAGAFADGLVRLNTDGSLDTSFNADAGVGDVFALALQPDGEILVGGYFSQIDGVSQQNVARLNTDGSLDTSFNASVIARVDALALQPDGRIVVGGEILAGDPTTQNNLIRLNADGSLDTSFNASTDANVAALALQSDGQIVIGGAFTMVNGVSQPNLARLNTDGSLDDSFGASTNFALDALALQPDGQIVIGGSFTEVDNVSQNGIARLNADGSLDASFNVNAVPPVYTVKALALQPDGKIIAGGDFDAVKGGFQNGIVRFNADGSLDTSFTASTGNQVSALALQSNGQIVIGGAFTTVNGVGTSSVVRLNIDGSTDDYFNADAAPGPNSTVTTLALQPDGKILVGGSFSQVDGVSQTGLARLNTDGSLDPTFSAANAGSVTILALQPDGKVLIGLTRLNADGSLDTSFNASTNGYVSTLALQPDGEIVIGGGFTEVNGTSQKDLARLNPDGSLDASFNAAVSGPSRFLALQTDGKILVAGIGGLTRLNPDGSADASFSAVDTSTKRIDALILQSDGKIVIGGFFTQVNGVSQTGIARLNPDGSLDSDFNASLYVEVSLIARSPSVYALALQPDGKILIGGLFTQVSGVARNDFARLNTDGSLDPFFAAVGSGPNQFVDALTLQSDGKILAAGDFTSFSGYTRNYVARLNAGGAPDFFNGGISVGDGFYYLQFPDGTPFGYYNLVGNGYSFPYFFHADLGMEYFFDANDNQGGTYLYDFASNTFFYTSPTFPFPYLYDFTLNSVLYYYPDPNNAGHYNTNGIRYFYDFNTGQIITK